MNIQNFIHEVVKEFGEKVIVPIDSDENFEVISTDSISLDIATGVGGIPTKKITEIYGAEGSGKSTLALILLKNYLAMSDKNVLYVDVENMMDTSYVRVFVEDNERFILSQPLTSEDALNLIEKAVKSGLFGLVILDSVGALSSKKEVENELEKNSYAGVAKLMAKFLRRIVPYIRYNNVSLVLINQVRDKIGSYLGGFDTPGGHSVKHFTTLRIMLSASTKIQKDDKIVGNMVKFVIKKNKVGSPFTSGEFPLIFGKGVDTISDVINFATKIGVLIRKGSYYYLNGEQIGQGVANVRNLLESSPETLDSIVKRCYNAFNILTKKEE